MAAAPQLNPRGSETDGNTSAVQTKSAGTNFPFPGLKLTL